MKAIVLKKFGPEDGLQIEELPTPVLRADEVLIENRAFSINPIDVKTQRGQGRADQLKNENPIILGWDLSGTIVSVGPAVKRFAPGDDVFGMINVPGHGKTFAQLVAAREMHLASKPKNVSHESAAAAGLAAMTAYEALAEHMTIHKGDKILIHGAAGGVGHLAVQIARNVLGAYVIGTSSAANRAFLLDLGVDQHIDYEAQPFESVSPQVDWILDTIGGENIDRSLQVLKRGGTIVSLPSGLSESVGEKAAAQGKKGIHFRVQSNGERMSEIAHFMQAGLIRPVISGVFPFGEFKLAMDQVRTGKTRGKVVVRTV